MKSTFRFSPLQAAVLLALASASSFSYALRLGEPIVKSYVGQPLVAEFAIEDTTPEELRRLQISLANASVYTSMKAAFHPSLKTANLSVLDRTGKTPKIVLRTEGPVEDSVVDIVFELTWAAGRMIQASTVLIDPAPAGVAVDAPAFVPSQIAIVEILPSVMSKPVALSDVPVATRLAVLGDAGSKTVVVQKGDTLSKIASRMNVSGVKVEQLLIALYNKNSKAIASKNINLIREGTILVLPTKQEALAVDAVQAMKTVALHASNFRSYAQDLAQQSRSSTSMDKTPRSQSGNVTSEIIEKKDSAPAKDRVRIGTGNEGATSGSSVDKAIAIQANKAKAEVQSRQTEMEKNLKDLEALVKLKNEQLAKMQQATSASSAAAASTVTPGLVISTEKKSKLIAAPSTLESLGTQAAVTPGVNIAKEAKVRTEVLKSETLNLVTPPSVLPAEASRIKTDSIPPSDKNKKPSAVAQNLEVLKNPVVAEPGMPSSFPSAPPPVATPTPATLAAKPMPAAASTLPVANPMVALVKPIVETPVLPNTLRPNDNISGPVDSLEKEKPLIESKPTLPVIALPVIPKETKLSGSATVVAPALVSSDIDEKWPFIAGGLGILAILGGWIYTRRKKDEDDNYVENVSTEVVPSKTYVFGDIPQTSVVAVQNATAIQEPKHYEDEFKNFSPIAVVEDKSQQYELSHEELSANSLLDELPAAFTPEPFVLVNELAPMPHTETIHFKEVPVHDVSYMETSLSSADFLLPTENTRVDFSNKHSALESSPFELNFNPNENLELENLTKSLALDMPSLDESTSVLDSAVYPVSLTYDPDEQLGIAKFYLGLQDYRGVWDMVHPLLNHERDDVKARAYELLSDIPEELREEWNASK